MKKKLDPAATEKKRLEALLKYKILDTPHEEDFDAITKLASYICQTPISLISLIDESRQWFKSSVGLDVTETHRDISFCQHTILGDTLFEIPDATKDNRFKNTPLVTGAPDIRFYAGTPLKSSSGFNIGSLCVIDTVPRSLTPEQKEALETLAKQVVAQLELKKINRELEMEIAKMASKTIKKIKSQKIFYESILNSLPADVVAFDENHNYLFINPTAINNPTMRKWLVGKNDYDYCTYTGKNIKIAEQRRKLFLEALKNKDPTEFQEELINREGEKEYHLRIMSPIYDARGNLKHVIGYGVNITTIKITKNELSVSKEKAEKLAIELAVALENASLKISVADTFFSLLTLEMPFIAQGDYFTKINTAFANALGYNVHYLLETPILSLVHLDDVQATKDEIQKLQQGIPTVRFVNRYRCKDNSYRWFEWTATPDIETRILYGVLKDITEPKKAELELQTTRNLLEQSNSVSKIGNWIRYIDNSDNYWTDILFDIFEIDRSIPKNERFQPSRDLVHPDDVSMLEKAESNSIEMGKDYYVEPRILLANGKMKHLAINGSSFFNDKGEVLGLKGTIQDITERKESERELIKAKELAEYLAGAKDQFLANMSHEIRTPLNGIIGFTKILLKNGLTETQRKQMNAIKTSSDILLVLINDILDLAKIEAGKMTLEKTELKVKNFLNSISSIFELQIEEKELKLTRHYDKRIPKFLVGDTIRITQVLFNLLSNAIKFTRAGGEITISANLLEQNEEKAIIEIIVSDTGKGISAEELEHIFEPFVQSSKDTSRKYGGTGLGLSIAKKLVNLMGGTITIQSEYKKGTTVTFTLPLMKSTVIAVTKENESFIDTNVQNQLGKLKILIVEDVPINQFLAQTIVGNFGFESDVAENGKIAIALLEKNSYDLILMDLMMPEMDGYEATQYIRNKMPIQKATIPIIALTAVVNQSESPKWIEVGMNDYVTKPINETELLRKIIHLLKRT